MNSTETPCISRPVYYQDKIRIISILKSVIKNKKKYVHIIDHSDDNKIKLFKENKISYL